MATRDQIKAILNLLATLPNCPITSKDTADIVTNMYVVALSDVPNEYLQAAYLQYISSNNPFFPSNPGTLREIAYDLEMTAQNIPTASQAWAMLLRGPERIVARFCDKGLELREAVENAAAGTYWNAVHEYGKHVDNCDKCIPSSRDGSYGSDVVDVVVRMMGGRDVIFTDNAAADRARFILAYNELVINERRKMQMVPEVREFIDSENRPALVGKGISQVAARLSAGGG
ncbi:MAG TPA: hypothetical protein PLN86_16335 [Candidatus Hydrogenedentes bacterium]|nr:hypothetical protein [Candidatus Hydrogenedentota bacterium]